MLKTTVLALFLMASPVVAFAGNVIRTAAPIVKPEAGAENPEPSQPAYGPPVCSYNMGSPAAYWVEGSKDNPAYYYQYVAYGDYLSYLTPDLSVPFPGSLLDPVSKSIYTKGAYASPGGVSGLIAYEICVSRLIH